MSTFPVHTFSDGNTIPGVGYGGKHASVELVIRVEDELLETALSCGGGSTTAVQDTKTDILVCTVGTAWFGKGVDRALVDAVKTALSVGFTHLDNAEACE